MWRLDALDEWRRRTVDPAIVRFDDGLRELVRADEIADAVVHAIGDRARQRFTFWQKAGGFAVAAVAVAGGVKGLIFG